MMVEQPVYGNAEESRRMNGEGVTQNTCDGFGFSDNEKGSATTPIVKVNEVKLSTMDMAVWHDLKWRFRAVYCCEPALNPMLPPLKVISLTNHRSHSPC